MSATKDRLESALRSIIPAGIPEPRKITFDVTDQVLDFEWTTKNKDQCVCLLIDPDDGCVCFVLVSLHGENWAKSYAPAEIPGSQWAEWRALIGVEA